MERFCIINNSTKDIAKIDGKEIIVSHPQLLEIALMYGLIDREKYDTICKYPKVFDGYPSQVGLYVVALTKRGYGSSVVIGLNDRMLFLSLGYWNGKYFMIDGCEFHYRNVASWLLICGEEQMTEFFTVKRSMI